MQSLIFVGTFFILFLLMYIFPTWIVYFAWQRGRWGWVRTILFLMPFGLGLVLAPLGLLVSLFSKPTGKIPRDNWLRELFYTSIGLGLGQMGAVYFMTQTASQSGGQNNDIVTGSVINLVVLVLAWYFYEKVKKKMDLPTPMVTPARAGYGYAMKNCSRCGKQVSLASGAGQRCPHCGALWSTEIKK